MTLRARIALLFLVSQFVMLFVFATGTLMFTNRRLIKTFDQLLVANAEALATLVEHSNEGVASIPLELHFSDDVMERFSRRKRPDLFAIFLADNTILEKSRSLSDVPDWVQYDEEREYRDFSFLGDEYRGVLLAAEVEPSVSSGIAPEDSRKITIFYATSRNDLNDDLEDILEFILGAAVVVAALSGALSLWVARRSLVELYRLADDAAQVDEQHLEFRFNVEQVPPDLRGLGFAFNEVLDRVQRAFDQQKQFALSAAHELRTPVAIIKSGIQSNLIGECDPAEDRKMLIEVLEDIDRLEKLCEALLLSTHSFERPIVGSWIPISDFLMEVEENFDAIRPLIRQGQEMELRLPNVDHKGQVMVDSVTTSRIISNLLTNAFRYGGRKIVLSFSVEPEGNRAFLNVEDDGAGVPGELKDRLFQRFARGHQSLSNVREGAGMGLYLSRIGAESIGGTLTHEDRMGGGSCFTWRISYRVEG